MTEQTTPVIEKPATEGNCKLVYILYLASLVFGITGLIGVIMAYINRNDAPEWLQQHYRFQIRTFWIGLVYALVGFLLTFVLVGFLILLFYLIWMIVRCVKGMKALEQKQPPANVTGWLF